MITATEPVKQSPKWCWRVKSKVDGPLGLNWTDAWTVESLDETGNLNSFGTDYYYTSILSDRPL